MKTSTLLISLFLFFCTLFTNEHLFAQKPVPAGAYRILSGQYGNTPAQTVEDNDKHIFKIFADGYWIAPWSMVKDSAFYGAGGGTYTCKDGKYVETLSFYSWDSTAVGKTYTFDYSAEGKFYHQWGTINSEKYPNFWIDEMLKKVDATEPLKNNGLEGAWMLESAQWDKSKYDRKATPDEVAMKIYAYPMVAYGYWNKKTGSFSGAGGGRYQFDGKTLTEHIEFSVWEKAGAVHEIAVSLGTGTYSQAWEKVNKEVWARAPMAPTTNAAMASEDKEKAAIQQVIVMETEHWLNRNLDAWSNSFVQSPSLLWTVTNGGEPGDVVTIRGWDGLKGFMKNWFGDEANSAFAKEMRKGTNTRDHWQIEIRGDVAWASFDQHMVNGEQTTVSTETRVLERVNGAWKITMLSALADFKDAVPPIRSRY